MNKDQQWIKALRKGHREVLGKIYLHHREGFLSYAQSYGLPEEELRDIYQDSIIALYENVRQGKLEDRKSTRLNSSHVRISYAVFCLKKKKKKKKKNKIIVHTNK